jgi:transposase-like protein
MVCAEEARVEAELVGGVVRCPACEGELGPWGHARQRVIRGVGRLRPRRAKCRGCGRTHVLLPELCLLRRRDAVAVIGAALVAGAAGAGHRAIAERLGVPKDTVRGWLRRFARDAEAIRAHFARWAFALDCELGPVGPAGGAVNVQSYVRGRIALYLDSSVDTGDEELDRLRRDVVRAEETASALAEALESDAVRSRTTSLLRTVSRQMTAWAQQLDLEHAGDGALIDLDRLTIVADTPNGPAYMDAGGIGSGMNWVGYHLTAYLALQRFFIEHERPVPSFIVFDQPSQAFFPRDRETGGDLDELTDTDRENTRRLYELTFEVVQQLGGALQVIALDHADFEDDWFANSVVQRWRGGHALIPSDWLDAFLDSRSQNSEAPIGGRKRRTPAAAGVPRMELGGLEPPTSWVRSRRSPN